MACNSCGSVNQGKFASEIEIYFPGLRNVNKRPVMYTLSLALVQKVGPVNSKDGILSAVEVACNLAEQLPT